MILQIILGIFLYLLFAVGVGKFLEWNQKFYPIKKGGG